MALTPSLPTGAPTGLPLTARRRIQAGMVARAVDGTPRTGVIPAHYGPLVTGKASWGYNVAEFVAVTSRELPGVEFVANDGLHDLSPAGYGAPGANSRLDLIWVRCRLSAFGDAANVTEFGIAQGQSNLNPERPLLPAGALELALAEVKATDTTTQTVVITPTHRFTALAGGVVALRSAAEATAWTPADGAQAYRIDTATRCERVAGVWRRQGASFRQFTTARGGMTDGSPFFQVPVEDTEKDTDPAFAYTYSNADGRITLEAGVYEVHATGHPGSVATGTTFLQLRGTAQGVLDRKSPAVSADPVMSVSALFHANGAEGLIVEIQKQTGGSSNASGTLRIARIGGV
ncbi:MAG: hypothetical protein K0S37_1979 [Microbacterium sp.]|jgi:hypothetical protein|nr:hypothetical protein [Microbacterium sp.]